MIKTMIRTDETKAVIIKKLWIAVLMIAVLMIQGILVSDFRAEAATGVSIQGGKVSANPGDTVSIPVMISGNTGLMGLGLDITYDADKFTSPKVSRGDVFADGQFNDSIKDEVSGAFKVMWAGTDAVSKDGTLFTVSLKVKENTTAGDYSITITNSAGDTFDGNYNDITPALSGGVVSVTVPVKNITISGTDAEAKQGDTVFIPVKVSGNSGIMGLGMDIGYDADVFTSPDVLQGEVCENGTFSNSLDGSTSGSFNVLWKGTAEVSNDGTIFTLSFKVREDAAIGNSSITFSGRADDTYDGNYNNVNSTCQPVAVTIKSNQSSVPTETVEIYSNAVTANRGSEVTIPLYLRNGDKIDGISVFVDYENEYLDIVSATPGAWYEGEDDKFELDNYDEFFSIYAMKYGRDVNFGNTSPFMYLTCKISSSAPVGELCLLSDENYGWANKENADGNWINFAISNGKITINVADGKASSTITLNNKTAEYTGEPIAIDAATVIGSTGAVTYTYYTNEACTNGATVNAPANIGTYYVKATVEEDANFMAATSNVAILVIQKTASQKGIPTVTLTNKSAVYIGKAIPIDKARVTGSSGTVTYTYYTDAACTKGKTTSAPKNAGIYYVKATVAETEEYRSATSNTARLTIQKASSSIRLKDKTALYSGKRISIGEASVKGSSGEVTYIYYSNKACTKDVTWSAPKNAGTYYIIASVDSDTNYNSAVSKVAKLTIKKAAQTIKGIRTNFIVKKGLNKVQTVKLGGKAQGKLNYAITGSNKAKFKLSSSGKLTIPKKMKKGIYKIKVQVTAKATTNYTAKKVKKTIKVVVK